MTPKYSHSRSKLISDLEKEMIERAEKIDRKISRIILEYLNRFSLDDNEIKNTTANNRILNRLNSYVFRNIGPDIVSFREWIKEKLYEVSELSKKYFDQFGNVEDVIDNVIEGIIKRLGFADNATVEEGSFAQQISDVNEITQATKPSIRGAIVSSGVGIVALRRSIRNRVIGNDGRDGLFTRKVKTQALDTFINVDSIIGRDVGQALGLRAAIYSGGIIESSRAFCRQRNGKVFTYDEINEFRNLSWPEKPDIYDPFVDPIGGYNCRHKWDHISDELAIILRPELKDIF